LKVLGSNLEVRLVIEADFCMFCSVGMTLVAGNDSGRCKGKGRLIGGILLDCCVVGIQEEFHFLFLRVMGDGSRLTLGNLFFLCVGWKPFWVEH